MSRLTRDAIAMAVCFVLTHAAVPTAAALELEHCSVDLGPQADRDLRARFGRLEPGEKEIDGILFDIPAKYVHVPPGESERLDLSPTDCGCIHFLHYTEHSGEYVGAYELVFEDGERVDVTLRGGINIQDWWLPGPLPFASPAHEDILDPEGTAQPVAFWRFSVQNPRPESGLTAIEINNRHNQAVINVVAITLSGSCGDNVGGVPVWTPDSTDEEKIWIAVLERPGKSAGKPQACQRLRRIGTEESIPALAACLGDELLSHPARLVLESMPSPEVDQALRNSLATASGRAKAGIVESLGVRGDRESVPLLTPLLDNDDSLVASAAALALGKIGGRPVVEPLKTVLADCPDGQLRMALIDGLLNSADSLRNEDEKAAHALYEYLLSQCRQKHIRTAAYRGMILAARSADAEELVKSALLTGDAALLDAALPAVRDVGCADATRAFADLVDRVPASVLPDLLGALAQRGDRAASPAVVELVNHDAPEVRTAAVSALKFIGDRSAVPVLVKLAAHGTKQDTDAASQTLARLDAPEVTRTMIKMLRHAGIAESAVIAEVLGRRGDTAARRVLRRLAHRGKGDARASAVAALAEVGAARDARLMVDYAADAETGRERDIAEKALVVLGNRVGTSDHFVKTLLSNLGSDNIKLRCVILAVCGKLDHPRLLDALGNTAQDEDAPPEVVDAAVRALTVSGNPEVLSYLLPLLDSASNLTHRALVLRSIARLTSNTDVLDADIRENAVLEGLNAADRPEEKKLLLGALGNCRTLTAFDCAHEYVCGGEAVAEAAIAWARIAGALIETHPDKVHAAAPGVLQKAREAGVPEDVENAIRELVPAPAEDQTATDSRPIRFNREEKDPK